MILKDEFLLQSCLKSISIDNDQGENDLRKLISIDYGNKIRFSWLKDSESSDKELSVKNGAFSLN